MLSVTGVLVFATVFAPALAVELEELLLPHAARDRPPSPSAPARSASRRVIMPSVISLSSFIYCVVK
jgi:hypothetical protein